MKVLRTKSLDELNECMPSKYKELKKRINDYENSIICFIENNEVENISEDIYNRLRHIRLVKNELTVCLDKTKQITSINAVRVLNTFDQEMDDLLDSLNKLDNI